jgi:hypothetical protein
LYNANVNRRWLLVFCLALVGAIVALYFAFKPVPVETVKVATPVPQGTTEPPTPDGWKELLRGEINVKNPYKDLGVRSGKILIQMWGCAVIDSKKPCLTPEGDGADAGAGYPYKGLRYGSILRINGLRIYPIGLSNDFELWGNESIEIGVNDALAVNGLGFEDNKGTWYYKLCVPK